MSDTLPRLTTPPSCAPGIGSVAARALLSLCLLAWSAPVEAVEPRPRPPAVRGPEDGGAEPRRDPDRRTGGGGGRYERREIEGGGRGETSKPEPMLALTWRDGGCAIDGHKKFVKSLLSLENPSDAMSLEVWGDAHEYAPYQKVLYYLRVPRVAYVTMLWIGPNQDIFVPFHNLRIPANRDVSVDPDSIIVPPLGREQWVALASLEPIPLSCWASETEHLSWLQQIRKLPHGVGRWEVRSKPSP